MPLVTDSTFKTEKNKQENEPVYLYAVFDYDGLRSSSAADGTEANHLIDSAANFVAGDIDKTIHNTSDGTYAQIVAVDSTTKVELSKDIMVSGEAYDLENNLYFAEYDINVSYDGITYILFPLKHQTVGENIQGEIDSVKVTLSNITRLIQSYLETMDWRGKKVRIRQVWADQLADLDAYIDAIYYIDSYTASADAVELTLTSKFDVLTLELPTRKYSRNYCSWVFKSTECGYSGGETECNKTKQRCKVLANYQRFGAFPSIPGRRLFVGG